jgi:hypothetical protein
VDFDRDLPTTAEDVIALRRAATARPSRPLDYLEFLRAFGDTAPEVLRARPGPRGDRPFELPLGSRHVRTSTWK